MHMAKVDSLIFVDESGDPGAPFVYDVSGKQIPTGTSRFYILAALCLSEQKLFQMEHRMMETKMKFGYTKEIKSNDVSLALYKELLKILNELNIKTYYRLIDKGTYKGVYKVDNNPK